MKPKDLEKIATLMGLEYNPSDNFEDMKARGIRVFNGCNGQRFLIDSNWKTDKIYSELGKALIDFGKRTKNMEIYQVLSTSHD